MKLGKIDLSQIECRILNTVAGQWDVVEKFRNKEDIYIERATQFYGRPITRTDVAERGLGKQIELSCGYGAGGPSIVRTARAGTYGPPVYLTDAQGVQARNLYRDTHKAVVSYWHQAEELLSFLASGEPYSWPPLYIHDHRIFHPSGMWLDFTSLRWEKDHWEHKVRNGWRKTYGARLVENVVQFMARQVISEKIVKVTHETGLRIPLTVHDDLILAIPDGELFDRAVEIVSAPLTWLPECPISCEAKIGENLE